MGALFCVVPLHRWYASSDLVGSLDIAPVTSQPPGMLQNVSIPASFFVVERLNGK
jgi:hypothetical protein